MKILQSRKKHYNIFELVNLLSKSIHLCVHTEVVDTANKLHKPLPATNARQAMRVSRSSECTCDRGHQRGIYIEKPDNQIDVHPIQSVSHFVLTTLLYTKLIFRAPNIIHRPSSACETQAMRNIERGK